MSTEDDEIVRRYLQCHDAACPACGYNLRNLTTGSCPECGNKVRLGVAPGPGLGLSYEMLLVGLAMSAGVGFLELLAWVILSLGSSARIPISGMHWLHVYPLLCGLGLAAAIWFRAKLIPRVTLCRSLAWWVAMINLGIIAAFLIMPRL